MEVVVITGAISHAKLQSNHHHQETNTQFFTGLIPFLSPNQQCQSTEGKISHPWTRLPHAYLGVFQLLSLVSLTTHSSLLRCGRVAMPLISPLMPIPQIITSCAGCRHNMPPPLSPWPFDLGVRVTGDVGYLYANFSLPRSLRSRLRPDVCDRQRSDSIIA